MTDMEALANRLRRFNQTVNNNAQNYADFAIGHVVPDPRTSYIKAGLVVLNDEERTKLYELISKLTSELSYIASV